MSDHVVAAPPVGPPAPVAPLGPAAVLLGKEVEQTKQALALENPEAPERAKRNALALEMHRNRFEQLLRDRFGVDGDTGGATSGGPLIPRARHFELAKALKEELGYRLYVTVCASHWPSAKTKAGDEAEHFEVATVLRSVGTGSHEVSWRVRLELGEGIDSLVPLFAGADWQEREQFDLVGVTFDGHPDLRRLMLPDEWEGHPLRRDYAIETRCEPWR